MSFQVNHKNPVIPTQVAQNPLGKTSFNPGKQVGTILKQQVGNLLFGLKAFEAMGSVYEKGPQAVCILFSLGQAVKELSENNIVKAASLGVVSVKAAMDLFSKNGSLAEMQKLLKENQAGLELAGEILSFNEILLKQVTTGVQSVDECLASVQNDLSKIEQLSDKNLEELKNGKKEVSTLYLKAGQEYTLAQKEFNKAKEFAAEANRYFSKTLEGFTEIYKLAKTEGAELSDVIKIAEEMEKNCVQAQEIMQQSTQAQEKARIYSNNAHKVYQEASTQSGYLIAKTELALSDIHKATEQAQQQVKEAQEQNVKLVETVDELTGNQEALVSLNKRLLANQLRMAREANNIRSYGIVDVMSAVAGAAVVAASSGVIMGIGAGVIALEASRHRDLVADKVKDFAFGKNQEKPLTFSAGQIAAWKFDDNSTGFWGRYQQKSSKTVGSIGIQLNPRETINFRFDLNQPHAVTDATLMDLKNTLERKLVTNEMTAKECLEIIQSLEKMKVGPKFKSVLSSDCPYFFLLKHQCNRTA
jgi:hypothetical protein